MSGGQIAALICAILLLLPGGCFLFFSIAMSPGTAVPSPALLLWPSATFLVPAGLLFWVAFRRRSRQIRRRPDL
jgi:membrane protein implicated in regulation of membrane protease activity